MVVLEIHRFSQKLSCYRKIHSVITFEGLGSLKIKLVQLSLSIIRSKTSFFLVRVLKWCSILGWAKKVEILYLKFLNILPLQNGYFSHLKIKYIFFCS